MVRYAVAVIGILLAFDLCSANGEIGVCSNYPCENGGTCQETTDGYTCTCYAGHHGKNCENDPLPPYLSFGVVLGGSRMEVNLEATSDTSFEIPVYSLSGDSSATLRLARTPSRTTYLMYQDRVNDAAFLLTTRTDNSGNTTRTLEGVVQKGDKVYRMKTQVDSQNFGTPTRRSNSNDTDFDFDVEDLGLNITDLHSDYTLPDNLSKEGNKSEKGDESKEENETSTSPKSNRYKRQTYLDVFIDVAAFADYKVYTDFYARSTAATDAEKAQETLDLISQYYALVFNGIDRLYKSVTTLPYVIHVRLIGLVIAQTAQASPITEGLRETPTTGTLDLVNAYTALSQIETLAVSATIPAHDHFMYFTGYDLKSDSGSTSVAGLAYVGTTCATNGKESSINEERGNYGSTFIAAHELGHSLSASHDGDGNSCASVDRYIMSTGGEAPTDATDLNLWVFSTCSADYFSTFISSQAATTAGASCVYEKLTVDASVTDVTSLMPGQLLDIDAQCKREFGDSVVARGCPAVDYPLDQICAGNKLVCTVWPTSTSYTCYQMTADRGTDCGVDMWCIDGQCVSKFVNECESSPCRNGGTCNDMPGYFTCTCPVGYSGAWCEDANPDNCASYPCLSGGTCVDGDNTYTCQCPPMIWGTNCEYECTWNDFSDNKVDDAVSYISLDTPTTSQECKVLCEQNSLCSGLSWYNQECRGYGNPAPMPGAVPGALYSRKECTTLATNACAGTNPCLNGGVCRDLASGYECVCAPGFSGVTCDMNIDECGSNPCLNGGTCSDGVNSYTCDCAPGFGGVRCDTNINECASGPCQNGGSCTDSVNGYTCTCAAGFSGTNCETNIDDCASHQCLNGGVCVDGINTYTCNCPNGYSGDRCQNQDPCFFANPCQNGGTCTNNGGTASCTCTSAYDGTYCENMRDACANNRCQNGATCNNFGSSYTCTCQAGFSGTYCENGACTSGPCQNSATCNDFGTSFTCTCVAGFSGTLCETNINDCSYNSCYNGGTCLDGINTYSCTCPTGYIGERCETVAKECPYNPCENGGVCDYSNYNYNCYCAPGFTGQYCQTATYVDCPYNPCQNGGTCDYSTGNYYCLCKPGYEGKYCEIEDVIECPYNPCEHGGTCDYSNYNYNCHCAPGYTGQYCEKAASQCPYNPCQNGGTCDYTNNIYTCHCPPWYAGTYCEIKISACSNYPCENGGTCQETTDGYTCTCRAGYYGKNCEMVSQCLNNPCVNGGTCQDAPDGYTCTCPQGFYGLRCELVSSVQCPYNPCANGGTCDYSGYVYTCTCPAGYSGTYCEIAMTSVCPYNPCANGGQCDYTGNVYKCICPAGYSGSYCEISSNPCSSNPCLNGGYCASDSTGYSCTCYNGYYGTRCENKNVPCPYNPCANNGVCDYTGYIYKCYCQPGYTGTYCEVTVL